MNKLLLIVLIVFASLAFGGNLNAGTQESTKHGIAKLEVIEKPLTKEEEKKLNEAGNDKHQKTLADKRLEWQKKKAESIKKLREQGKVSLPQ